MDDEKVVYPESRELFRNLLNQLLGGRSAIRSDSNYTFRPYDGVVLFTSSAAITATIPADMFALNYVLTGVQFGAGTVTMAAGDGVTFVSKDDPAVTAGQYTMVMAKQVAENVWLLFAIESSGGGGSNLVAPTFVKTGNWLYEPDIFVVPGVAYCTPDTPVIQPSGVWITSFNYNEYAGASGGLLTLEITDLEGVTSSSSSIGFNIVALSLTSLSLPALKYVMSDFTVSTVESLASLSIPVLEIVVGAFQPNTAPLLTSLDTSSLIVAGSVVASFLPQLTSWDLSGLIRVDGNFAPHDMDLLTTLDLPLMVQCGTFGPNTMADLTTINVPSLATLNGPLSPHDVPQLTSLSLPALTHMLDVIGMDGSGLDGLTSFSIGSGLIQAAGDVVITNPPLDQASVDNVLVRYAALDGTGATISYDDHSIDVSGNCAPPSAAGLMAKAILEGRGNTVTVNS